jgi:hypothetical protein
MQKESTTIALSELGRNESDRIAFMLSELEGRAEEGTEQSAWSPRFSAIGSTKRAPTRH